jgi:hypothetical protein
MIRVRAMIKEATAVAARTVRNQNKRLPRRRNAPGTLEGERGSGTDEVSVATRAEALVLAVGRRTGESHGRIVWARRLLSTPERP